MVILIKTIDTTQQNYCASITAIAKMRLETTPLMPEAEQARATARTTRVTQAESFMKLEL